jgi:hypothetical protein
MKRCWRCPAGLDVGDRGVGKDLPGFVLGSVQQKRCRRRNDRADESPGVPWRDCNATSSTRASTPKTMSWTTRFMSSRRPAKVANASRLPAAFLRAPETYRIYLEEAFGRAGVPAHFARGAVRPDPAGRAFYALLRCAAEGLSARRFAEYLSLGQVPDASADGGPPPPPPPGDRWVTQDD